MGTRRIGRLRGQRYRRIAPVSMIEVAGPWQLACSEADNKWEIYRIAETYHPRQLPALTDQRLRHWRGESQSLALHRRQSRSLLVTRASPRDKRANRIPSAVQTR